MKRTALSPITNDVQFLRGKDGQDGLPGPRGIAGPPGPRGDKEPVGKMLVE